MGMNQNIRQEFKFRNPFQSNHILIEEKICQLSNSSWPCVTLASPSTMMSGTSRELFENWCENKKNGLIITDYAVQGTLARQMLSNPRVVLARNGHALKMHMTVDAISFSAHADFRQTREFIDILKLSHAISSDIERHVYTPEINQQVKFYHKNERSAKIIGKLAKNKLIEDNPINGILIQKMQNNLILHPHDLAVYTNLKTSGISHRQVLPLKTQRTFDEICYDLTASFKHLVRVSILKDSFTTVHKKLTIGNIVNVTYYNKKNLRNLLKPIPKQNNLKYRNSLILEWLGGSVADLIVDCIIIFITKIENVQNTIKPVNQKTSKVKNPNIFNNMFENINNKYVIKNHTDNLMFRIDGFSLIFYEKMSKVVCPENINLENKLNKLINITKLV